MQVLHEMMYSRDGQLLFDQDRLENSQLAIDRSVI